MAPPVRLTFLGTGAPLPTGDRVQTGLLLDRGDSRLLIDCGSGVLHRLVQADTSVETVSNVLLTHHHLDHVADLLPLMKARWFAEAPSLTVAGPTGTNELVNDLLDVFEYLQAELEITVREVGPESFSFAGFDVDAFETKHVMDCLAYRLSPSGYEEPVVTFSGDSEAFDELAEFADGSDVLIHDCAYTDAVSGAPHATPSALGRTLQGHSYGRLFLTHLTHETEGHHREMIETIRGHYEGDVRIAHDGFSIELSGEG